MPAEVYPTRKLCWQTIRELLLVHNTSTFDVKTKTCLFDSEFVSNGQVVSDCAYVIENNERVMRVSPSYVRPNTKHEGHKLHAAAPLTAFATRRSPRPAVLILTYNDHRNKIKG